MQQLFNNTKFSNFLFMNAWIDMDNSPHVHLLIPFVLSLEKRNFTTHITARDYAQTIDLLNESKVTYTKIGKHGGAFKLMKVVSLITRVFWLVRFASGKNFSIGINHGSRSHALACKLMGIPCYIGMDYERTESTIFAFCARRIWIPDLLFPGSLPFIGVTQEKVITYPGIKEQFYLDDFIPDPTFKQKNSIPADKVLVVLRPPADMANYHNAQSEVMLENVIRHIRERKDLFTICTPRTPQQKSNLKKFESPAFRVLEKTLDGKNLAYYADVMISGGGTMNREAAYFGAQVYSIFSGPKPLLDLELQRIGLLSFIESPDDCFRVEFKEKTTSAKTLAHSSKSNIENLIDQFIQLSSESI